MSVVTNIIISGTAAADHLERINKVLSEHDHYALCDCSDCAGGEKWLETDILVGAFNYLDIPWFIGYLKIVPWEFNTIVLIQGEDQDEFIKVRLTPHLASSQYDVIEECIREDWLAGRKR